MNEIDQTVERIGQLPESDKCKVAARAGTHFHSFGTVGEIRQLATAYTQLKADLATAKQGLEHYQNPNHWKNADLVDVEDMGKFYANEYDFARNGYDLAQQTLDAIKPNAAAGGEGTDAK